VHSTGPNVSIDTKTLEEEAKNSRHKEAYKLLEKTQACRIGVGARVNSSPQSSFFIEVIIKLSEENSEVNLSRLKKIFLTLEVLQERGYKLTYQDGNSISCEKTMASHEISDECTTAKKLVRSF